MRIVEVDRRKLLRGDMRVPGAEPVTSEWVNSVLDRHRIPDGFPLVIDDDGTLFGCDSLNQYLLDALDQNGFELGSMRRFHVYNWLGCCGSSDDTGLSKPPGMPGWTSRTGCVSTANHAWT